MKRIAVPIAAAALIGLGAAADHIVGASSGQPAIASTTPISSTLTSTQTSNSSSSPSVSTASVDAATEHAYTVASRSVVYVLNVGVGSGSGVVFDSKGDIVTNAHVVSGASSLKVTTNTGKTVPASIVGVDATDDLAVIHVNASGLIPAHFASASGYQVAQTVLAIGSPLGLQDSVTSGLISGLNRVEQEPNGAYLSDAIQTSAPINPGNSGGALVTLSGTVVGMPTLVQTSSSDGTTTQDIGFAIPSQRIVYLANQMIAHGKVLHTGRAYLGIVPADADTASQGNGYFGFGGGNPFGGGNDNTTTVNGALVQQLAAGGPAAKAGMQQGDVITSANGTQITSAQDLLTVLAHQKPGSTISLTLNRNGSTMTVHVHLGELPAKSS
jgi:S1-C subfamily serine protease